MTGRFLVLLLRGTIHVLSSDGGLNKFTCVNPSDDNIETLSVIVWMGNTPPGLLISENKLSF